MKKKHLEIIKQSMSKKELFFKARQILVELTVNIDERSVGSQGNLAATCFFRRALSKAGWTCRSQKFGAIDWKHSGAVLKISDDEFKVVPSPWSTGINAGAALKAASSADELEKGDHRNSILLLHGEIAREQLMPKNFHFYNPEIHRRIISLLEKCGALALVCATGRNPELAGGVYPFPLIEDGDFDIPSVYMTEEEGKKLLGYTGSEALLISNARRIASCGYNIYGTKGNARGERIVISAHIDSKKGSPGAIDNASGISVLLLLADLLKDYSGNRLLEIIALNGEDHYNVPGQMAYIEENRDRFDRIMLNINIDGAGYREGKTSLSFFNLPGSIMKSATETVNGNSNIVVDLPWYQGDHSIFVQQGRPAIAVTSHWFIENMASQEITHTPKDNMDIVDCSRLADIALLLERFIRKL